MCVAVPGTWSDFYSTRSAELLGAAARSGAVPALARGDGRPRGVGALPAGAAFVDAYAIVFALETMLDPVATGPLVRVPRPRRHRRGDRGDGGLRPARRLPRLPAALRPARDRARPSPGRTAFRAPRRGRCSCRWWPIRSRCSCTRRFPPPIPTRSGSSTRRCSSCVALGLRARLVPQSVAPDQPALRGFLREALAYVALYYALWAGADVLIQIAGLDVGWLLRVVPEPALLRLLGAVRVRRASSRGGSARRARRTHASRYAAARGPAARRGSPTTPLGPCRRRLGIEERLRVAGAGEQPRPRARRGGRLAGRTRQHDRRLELAGVMAGGGRGSRRARRWRGASAPTSVGMPWTTMTSRRPAPRRAGRRPRRAAARRCRRVPRTRRARSKPCRASDASTSREHGAQRVPAQRRRCRRNAPCSAEHPNGSAGRRTASGDARAEALGQRVGDLGVGGERQMRAVLLGARRAAPPPYRARRAARRSAPARSSVGNAPPGAAALGRRGAGAAGARPVQRAIAAAAGPARLIDAAAPRSRRARARSAAPRCSNSAWAPGSVAGQAARPGAGAGSSMRRRRASKRVLAGGAAPARSNEERRRASNAPGTARARTRSDPRSAAAVGSSPSPTLSASSRPARRSRRWRGTRARRRARSARQARRARRRRARSDRTMRAASTRSARSSRPAAAAIAAASRYAIDVAGERTGDAQQRAVLRPRPAAARCAAGVADGASAARLSASPAARRRRRRHHDHAAPAGAVVEREARVRRQALREHDQTHRAALAGAARRTRRRGRSAPAGRRVGQQMREQPGVRRRAADAGDDDRARRARAGSGSAGSGWRQPRRARARGAARIRAASSRCEGGRRRGTVSRRARRAGD